MFRFLESICFDGSGYPLLDFHQERVNRAFQTAYPGKEVPQLKEMVPNALPEAIVYKIRVLYNDTENQVEVIPYIRKPIASLKLISSSTVQYDHKYADRSEINSLFGQRGGADDILIVKNGLLTDSSYANIGLLKNGIWYTPTFPLLAGVRREELISSGKIEPRAIRPEELDQFEQISLFNALIGLGELVLPIEMVKS